MLGWMMASTWDKYNFPPFHSATRGSSEVFGLEANCNGGVGISTAGDSDSIVESDRVVGFPQEKENPIKIKPIKSQFNFTTRYCLHSFYCFEESRLALILDQGGWAFRFPYNCSKSGMGFPGWCNAQYFSNSSFCFSP